jgi:hypothetical protein
VQHQLTGDKNMKKLLYLVLVGCLFSPTVFAGETIQLAQAMGNGPVDNSPVDNSPIQLAANDDDNNRGGGILGDISNGKSVRVVTTTAIIATGAIVAGMIWTFSDTKSTSSH